MFQQSRKVIIEQTGVIRDFIRNKRTSTISPSTQRVVNQLSAISATRKQPKLINLCNEDLIKHRTITNAWKLYNRKKKEKRMATLQKQYESIKNAMEDLKHTSPELYEAANKKETEKRFPIEMRVPTEYPPTKPWIYEYTHPSEREK